MDNMNTDLIIIIFSGILLILLSSFFYLFIRIRILIKRIFKNMSDINYNLRLIEKNKHQIPDIEKISIKLKELSDKLKDLSDNIKGIKN